VGDAAAGAGDASLAGDTFRPERVGSLGGDDLKLGMVGTTSVKSSCAFDGLLPLTEEPATALGRAGLPLGEAVTLCVPIVFVGVGRLDSLTVATWPGRELGAVRLGVTPRVLGVTAVLDLTVLGGLLVSVEGWPRTEYGPAVAGRGAISGRLLPGLTGAPDKPAVAPG
jgi:hypothetical protein